MDEMDCGTCFLLPHWSVSPHVLDDAMNLEEENIHKQTIKKCLCNGKISECLHNMGMVTSFGSAHNLFTGEVEHYSDPSWQCFCCGMPMIDAGDKNHEP